MSFKPYHYILIAGLLLLAGCSSQTSDTNSGSLATLPPQVPPSSATPQPTQDTRRTTATQTPSPRPAASTPALPVNPNPSLLPSPATKGLVITDIKNASIEYQLAYLDSSHLPRDDDPNAARIRSLLNSIAQKTGDDPQHIGDQARRATIVLKQDYSKQITIQQFLEQADQYLLTGGPKTKFDDLATMLTMVMSK